MGRRETSGTEQRYKDIFERSHVALFEQDLSALRPELRRLHGEHGDRLRAILQGDTGLITSLLQKIRVVDANDTAVRMLKKPREELLRASRPIVADWLPYVELLAAIAEGGADRWEQVVTLIVGDGSVIKAICGVTMMDGDDGVHAIVAMHDITDRERLRDLTDLTRDELSRAERISAAGMLSVSLAHELGQPVSSIAITAAIGARSLDQDIPDLAAARRAFERIKTSALRAGDLMHRTREQLVRRDRAPCPVDIVGLARASVRLLEYETMLDSAKVSVASDCDVAIVLADRVELQQVLVNLIRNALRANRRSTPPHGHVHISIQTGGGPEATVSVHDQGGGLPPGQEARVFDPLFSTDPSGMGLGLAISRTILRDLGGEMIARNNADGGATFSFTLPIQRSVSANANR